MPDYFLNIAVPTPLYRCFDYKAPSDVDISKLKPGCRIEVPFGRRQLIGLLQDVKTYSDYPKCKAITRVIDHDPILPEKIHKLCHFAAEYYQHPIGQVLTNALPNLLRQGKPAICSQEIIITLSKLGKQVSLQDLKRAPKQAAAIVLLKKHKAGLSRSDFINQGFSSTLLKNLIEKDWVHLQEHTIIPTGNPNPIAGPALSEQQQSVIHDIEHQSGFNVFLVDGVTGSGKTEVYMQCIAKQLAQNKQALVLIPEIGLTPQTLKRFQQRFTEPVVAFHSGLTDKERLNAWLLAKEGKARVIIGTRSALFTPIPALGMIIIDEEHDSSFKQQDNFRYHARDLAVIRAKFENIPLILGTATPSLESLYNVENQRYRYLSLPNRAGNALKPTLSVIDLRNKYLNEGFSDALIQAIAKRLNKKEQVLLFLNRRGFSSILLCHNCGWVDRCQRCSANMIVHQKMQRVICHHCNSQHPLPKTCPECRLPELRMPGLGTEKLESFLQASFPDAKCARIDRDAVRSKTQLDNMLHKINSGKVDILIGTQMLAKGHHFPNVTLAAIIDADSGLFSADFRAVERMGQLLIQVAGRSGRAEKPGEVIIQTHHPDHPLLQCLLTQGYGEFAKAVLQEREAAQLPPYSYLVIFKAKANDLTKAMRFLTDIKRLLPNNIDHFGPIPAVMPKRAGFYRAQLLLQSNNRKQLQYQLQSLRDQITALPSAKTIRWSLDVDPLDVI